MRKFRPLFLLACFLMLFFGLNAHGTDYNGLQLASNAIEDLTGKYQAVVNTRRGKRRSIVTLVQTGNEVTGVWEESEDARIVGVRDGNKVTFEWFLPGSGYDLIGYWEIISATEIVGKWARPDGKPGGKWKMTKIE